MNDYDFVVEGTYEGNWIFPMSKDSAYGTLIIEKEFMTLRILIKIYIQKTFVDNVKTINRGIYSLCSKI